MVTVRSLVQLLHGCPAQTFWFSQLQELSLLLETLQISLTSEKAASLQESLETNCDVVITMQVQSNKRKRKTYGQTKQYRDWSKAGPDQVIVKEEPMETEKTPHVFTKVTYSKHYSLQLPGLSHDMDHSYKKRKMEAATPSKADIQLGSSIMVTPVAVPPEPVLAEESVLEQETVTTLIINNDQPSLAQESFIIQTVPARPLKKARSSNNPPGEVKTEEEAKAMAAPFIGKVETKPPKYRCMFDDCSYVNARLLMTQTHVYKHLQVFTFQCSYCDLKCRLETNFEKHLNTHGLTRRKDKMDRFLLLEKAGIQQRVMMGPPHQTQQVTFPEKIENIKDDQKIILSEGKGEGDTDGNEDDTAPLVSVKKSSVIGNYQDEGAEQETAGKCYTSLEEHQYHINNKVQTLVSKVFLLIISNFRLCLLGKKRRSQ